MKTCSKKDKIPSPNYSCSHQPRCNGRCWRRTSLQARTWDEQMRINLSIIFNLVLFAILAACAGPVLIFAGKLGWPDVPRPAFNPWLSMNMRMVMMMRRMKMITLAMMVVQSRQYQLYLGSSTMVLTQLTVTDIDYYDVQE